MLSLGIRKKCESMIFDDFYTLFQTNQAMDRALLSMQAFLKRRQTNAVRKAVALVE
jgi:hypothetical protein